MPTNYDLPGMRKAVAKQVLEDIDAAAIKLYDDGPRNHLGASLIGHKCNRYLWFVFRWVKHTVHTGRMYRLFNRGHKEEDRFVEWLRVAGFEVWTHDESKPRKPDGTFPQFRISGCKGHFGGSLDGVVKFPPRYDIPEPHLLEFKTNATGKGFTDLITSGVELAKPQHFDQQSVYGAKYGFANALYMNVCKNDDNIHVQVVKLDLERGKYLEKKAEGIIEAQEAPERISEHASFFECKYCDFSEVCHHGAKLDRNCRSCRFAKPDNDARWYCDSHKGQIPEDFIKTGCGNWTEIYSV